jgi:hypothetical protein
MRLALLQKGVERSNKRHLEHEKRKDGPVIEMNSMKIQGNVGGIGTNKAKATALVVQ